jgi:cold shock CspA family protein
MVTGKILRLCCNKGYGFVQADGETGNVGVYFDGRDLSVPMEDVRVGDRVEYVLVPGPRPVARNVFALLPEEEDRVQGTIESFKGSWGLIRALGATIFYHSKECNFFCDEKCVCRPVSFVPADTDRGTGVKGTRVRLED